MPEPPSPVDAPVLDAPAPDWFRRAVERPVESRWVDADGCSIHYLQWPSPESAPDATGILFLHGGGAHANWWRFIAPYFCERYRVAAMDLSGMGDSGSRPAYSATVRAGEIQTVLEDAGLLEPRRPRPIVVGHSFGGLTAMRYASLHGDRLGGFVIAESPVRPPAAERAHFATRRDVVPRMRRYESYQAAVASFRLRPRQSCENAFIVELIARHSVRRAEDGWTWKFDPRALVRDRHREPFRDYLQGVTCRTALVFGERSALVTPEVVDYMSALLGPAAPIVGIPEAQHHLTLDQPLAFVAAVRALLEGWSRAP